MYGKRPLKDRPMYVKRDLRAKHHAK